jgi:protein tyrosine kinase modulator
LKEYGAQYTAKNPKVIQAQSQLGEINNQIAQLTAGDQGASISSAEARELRSMRREQVRIQTELAVTQRELQRKKAVAPNTAAISSASQPLREVLSPAGGDASGEVGTDYETLRKRYDVLLDRQDQLERSQFAAAGLDPGIFQLVDMPAEPRMPVGPNRFKFRMFALALSLGIAFLVAFALEIPRLYSITDHRDVEYYLGVPVIALIPETTSPAEGKSRQLLIGRTIGVLVVAALMSAALLLLKDVPIFTHISALLR